MTEERASEIRQTLDGWRTHERSLAVRVLTSIAEELLVELEEVEKWKAPLEGENRMLMDRIRKLTD